MKRRGNRAVVITDAQRSQEDQLRTRETRYILMMSIRVLSLVVAAVVVSLQPPLLWLWLALCAIGMIFVPWLAVVLANDPLPKDRHRWRRYRSDASDRPALDADGDTRTISINDQPSSPAGAEAPHRQGAEGRPSG